MPTLHYRETAGDYLRGLAQPEESWEVHMSEVVNVWFDFYRPADDPSTFAPGVFERGVREFEACFSKEEVEAMREFHRYFSSVIDRIDDAANYDQAKKEPLGLALAAEARKALAAFERKNADQSLQRNAGSRPSSDDLSASKTPSSLGPRG